MDLKVGDVVKLKTGGPKMTVNRVGPFGQPDREDFLQAKEVEAVWFGQTAANAGSDGWEYVSTHRFGAEALEVAAP